MTQAVVDEALGPILAWRSDEHERRPAGVGAFRLRFSAHAEIRGDAPRGALAGARSMDQAAGRHARRGAAHRARQPQGAPARRAGAASAPHSGARRLTSWRSPCHSFSGLRPSSSSRIFGVSSDEEVRRLSPFGRRMRSSVRRVAEAPDSGAVWRREKPATRTRQKNRARKGQAAKRRKSLPAR